MTNHIYQFLYKRDKPRPIKILGIIVAIFSVGGLVYSLVLGVIMALGAVGLIAYQSGIEVNFEERTYRLINAFGHQGFGSWESLPPLKCVSLFKTQLVSTTYARSSASVTTRDQVIQVNLATEQNARILLFETNNIEEAIVIAKEASHKLNLKIWDATTSDGKWMN